MIKLDGKQPNSAVYRAYDANKEFTGLAQKCLDETGWRVPHMEGEFLPEPAFISSLPMNHPGRVISFARLEDLITSGCNAGVCPDCGEVYEGDYEPDREGGECYDGCDGNNVMGAESLLIRWT